MNGEFLLAISDVTECPLWVMNGLKATSALGPLFTQLQSMLRIGRDVRFVSITDVWLSEPVSPIASSCL
jgi:hypothetical protein